MTEIDRMKQASKELAETLTEEQKKDVYDRVKEMNLGGPTPKEYFDSMDPYSKDRTFMEDHEAATNNIFILSVGDSLGTSFDYYFYHSNKTEAQFARDVKSIMRSPEVGEKFLGYSKINNELIGVFNYALYSLTYMSNLGYHLIAPNRVWIEGPEIVEPLPKKLPSDLYDPFRQDIAEFKSQVGSKLFNKFVEYNQSLLKKSSE